MIPTESSDPAMDDQAAAAHSAQGQAEAEAEAEAMERAEQAYEDAQAEKAYDELVRERSEGPPQVEARPPEDRIEIDDPRAQRFVDREVVQRLIVQTRGLIAELKVQWHLANKGLMPHAPNEKVVHAQRVKVDYEAAVARLEILVDMLHQTDTEAIREPSKLDVVSQSL